MVFPEAEISPVIVFRIVASNRYVDVTENRDEVYFDA